MIDGDDEKEKIVHMRAGLSVMFLQLKVHLIATAEFRLHFLRGNLYVGDVHTVSYVDDIQYHMLMVEDVCGQYMLQYYPLDTVRLDTMVPGTRRDKM